MIARSLSEILNDIGVGMHYAKAMPTTRIAAHGVIRRSFPLHNVIHTTAYELLQNYVYLLMMSL